MHVRVHEASKAPRACSAAIILLKLTTLTFESLFYWTWRRWECRFVNKLVETI
jgi:hypothetical protein